MAETNDFVLGEPSSHCHQTDQTELQSAVKSPKDQHSDSLHRLLQKAALQSHKDFVWSRTTTCRTPQNLFLEGFKDCASEVIRFLTEEENVEDNSPLLMGLQSHLMNVGKTICHETIIDLDNHDAEMEEQKYDAVMSSTIISDHNDNERFGIHVSPFSPCLISPVVSRSATSSVSDTSATESDISMSVSLASERSIQSLSSDVSFSLHNASGETSNENILDHSKVDDVFHSPSSHLQSSTSYSVLPLRLLSKNALQSATHPGHVSGVIQESLSEEISLPVLYAETGTYNSSTSSMQYLSSLNHSSPLPESSTKSTTYSGDSCNLSQCLCIMSKSETNNRPQLSIASTQNESVITNTNPSISNSLLPQQPHQFLQGVQASGHISFQSCVPLVSNTSDESQTPSEFSLQLSSVLELKANFLPGIETSSVASGNFADVLLAVESCRFHEDPRVRALAEELVHLIHNDEFEDEDDDFAYDHVDEEENVYNVNGENDVESGIEMLDESADWGNAVDMIEQ